VYWTNTHVSRHACDWSCKARRGLAPAVEFPRDAANLHLESMGLQRIAQIPAVFFDSVGGHVLSTEQRDEFARHWGSART